MQEKDWISENWFKVIFLLLCLYAVFLFQRFINNNSEVVVPAEPEIRVIRVESSTTTGELSSQADLTKIIKNWYPSVVKTSCFVKDAEDKVYELEGSGFLRKSGQEIYVMTNKHVISGVNGALPELCTVKLSSTDGSTEIIKIKNDDGTSQNVFLATSSLDYGHIVIKYPDEAFIKASSSLTPFCKSRASLGTPLVTIGYPSIGSESDITVTQGIVAGYEGSYYITDAKISTGNSGGAAINLKESCLMGITSYARIGEAETLGRILDIHAILESLTGIISY